MAGSGVSASVDGVGTMASFLGPSGMTVATDGVLYVSDSSSRVKRITTSGLVTTFAGTGGTGMSDGAISSSTFSGPYGLAIDTWGNLFIADSSNARIRLASTSGLFYQFIFPSENVRNQSYSFQLKFACS